MKRLQSRFVATLGVAAVVAILLLGAGSSAATTTNPPPEAHSVLATIPLVDSIVANSTMVFAQGVTNCSQIWGITPSGTVSVYATVPVGTSVCEEGALALVPSTVCEPNGWGNSWLSLRNGAAISGGGDKGCCDPTTVDILYDALDGVLYEITDGGANVTSVATFAVPAKASESMGLTYDQVGSFNHDLVVTSSSGGKIWLVNSTGAVALLTELHTYIGGPAVAPQSFGSFGGEILVAAKTLGEVEAISASGNVSTVTNWAKANAVAFPSSGGRGWNQWGGCGQSCSFGSGHDVFFVANYTSGAVEAFPASDFRGFSGQGFVAGGLNQGIASFSANGATTLFASQTLRLSNAAFISCFPENNNRGW